MCSKSFLSESWSWSSIFFSSSGQVQEDHDHLCTKSCNGRALDRVTKQKHLPNRQKLSKKCPKIVFSPFRTIFGHFLDNSSTFLGRFVDIPYFLAVQPFARDKPSLWGGILAMVSVFFFPIDG